MNLTYGLTLEQWMEEVNWKDQAVADFCDVSVATISKIRRTKQWPGRALALDLAILSKGRISLSGLADPAGEAERQAAWDQE